jgi:hypothetical protein
MVMSEKANSIVLPKRPFLRGIARLFDWGGSLDHDVIGRIRARYRNPPPISSTEESIRASWEAVGESMRWAIGEYDKALRQQNHE